MAADGKPQNRKNLEKRERATTREILAAFQKSYKKVEKSFDLLLFEIQTAQRRGETLSPGKFAEQMRLKKILGELSSEMLDLSRILGDITSEAQSLAVDAGVSEARDYLAFEAALSGLDKQAARSLVGLGGNGDPISKLFARLAPAAVESVKDALITGIIAGSPASVIASEIKTAVGTTTARALTIQRTETLRSYREASRQFYAANKKLVAGYVWISALGLNTCAMCWALHGRIFKTSEKFATHPNCRCSLAPVLVESLRLKQQLEVKRGEAIFRTLTGAQRRAILGTRRFDLYERGQNTLESFVGEKKTEFGKARFIKPLALLMIRFPQKQL